MSEERKIFGQPIREETTKVFFPRKMDLKEFISHINPAGFYNNLIQFKENDPIFKEKYIEEWTELFLAWSEIEEER